LTDYKKDSGQNKLTV